ncbi:MAG: M23 family metallopeptidase [Flavobacteriaceae bacterium]|nr:M23 family metallopeptidase [Flavobacteriaceae bacterium]
MRRIVIIGILLGIIGTIVFLLIPEKVESLLDRSARAAYIRNFEKNDSTFMQWKNAREQALRDSLLIALPYVESGIFDGDSYPVHAYNFQLQEGSKLIISLENEIDTALVFIEIFQKEIDSENDFRSILSNKKAEKRLEFISERYATYKLIVQPEVDIATSFLLKIYTQPSYPFPVVGTSNKDVQSLWGADRGAGQRSHEGIDIFADKGTPVIALTEGVITTTDNKGLGGKQVWMRGKKERDKSFYYAHLDSIAVEKGNSVQQGDTLGFVGNTGNAEFTAPHLHFGIYKDKQGAVNPFPFIERHGVPKVDEANKVMRAVVESNAITIHQGPSAGLPELFELRKSDTVIVLGAFKNWYHIQRSPYQKGYAESSYLKAL